MSEVNIRLGQTIKFDQSTEKDILDRVNFLKEHGKLGKTINVLLKAALENPSIFGIKEKEVLNHLGQCGITPSRNEYIDNASVEIMKMRKKIDEIYDMCFKMYTLAQMNKHLGLEDKADNGLMATFVLEKQLGDMCSTLGINNLNYCQSSNKLLDTEEKSKECLEYIINTYSGLIATMEHQIKPVSNYEEINRTPEQRLQTTGNSVIKDMETGNKLTVDIEGLEKPDIKKEDKEVVEDDTLVIKPVDNSLKNDFLSLLGE